MEQQIPIPQKVTLTIPETTAYTNISMTKIHSLLLRPNCPFVLHVGTQKLVKRKEFEDFISRQRVI